MSFVSKYLEDSKALHHKEVTIGDQTESVWVRKMPMADIKQFVEEHASPDIQVRLTAGLRTLCKSLRNEDDSPIMTFEQAKLLPADAIKELVRVFSEVNTVDEKND